MYAEWPYVFSVVEISTLYLVPDFSVIFDSLFYFVLEKGKKSFYYFLDSLINVLLF